MGSAPTWRRRSSSAGAFPPPPPPTLPPPPAPPATPSPRRPAPLPRWRAAPPPWRFVFAQFPAVDGYTHQTWPASAKVLRALRRVDRLVGELAGRLRARGWLKDALILLVSDHGAAQVHTHLDLAEWFRAQGVPTLAH